MYAFVFWCEDVIFVISPRESQRPPTTSLTVVLSPSSKISCWQHCQFSWSEPLERITKKAIFRNLGQNYITYIANSSWGCIWSIPWKSEKTQQQQRGMLLVRLVIPMHLPLISPLRIALKTLCTLCSVSTRRKWYLLHTPLGCFVGSLFFLQSLHF